MMRNHRKRLQIMTRSAPGKAATPIPKAKLRRIALEQQGLLKEAPFGRGKNATLKAIEQIGYVQIDTISVVARAHDHVLHARVPNYRPEHLTRLQREMLATVVNGKVGGAP